MNCPKCETQAAPNQKFCRACGENLQVITKPLTQAVQASNLKITPEVIRKNKTSWTRRMALWGFIIMFIGVINAIFGKMVAHDEMITFTGVLLTVVGMFLTVFPYVFSSSRANNNSASVAQPEQISIIQSHKLLPPENDIDYVPSITERTTNLLNYPIKTKPQESGGLRNH